MLRMWPFKKGYFRYHAITELIQQGSSYVFRLLENAKIGMIKWRKQNKGPIFRSLLQIYYNSFHKKCLFRICCTTLELNLTKSFINRITLTCVFKPIFLRSFPYFSRYYVNGGIVFCIQKPWFSIRLYFQSTAQHRNYKFFKSFSNICN